MSTMTTLYRTFGNSAYCPARKDARICDAKYYLVTLQDYETDQGDGHYLLDTETVYLMPGRKARAERESRMNHCNRIIEYTGPVYALLNGEYPCQPEAEPLFTSEQAATAAFVAAWYRKKYAKPAQPRIERLR